MRQETINYIAPIFHPSPILNIWQWAQKNVDFSFCPNYETPLRSKYDPEFMPFWKEPVEALTDPSVNEVWVLKCSRAGGSENLLLNAIRYSVACNPQSTLYITADQKSCEKFMEKRIKDGLKCATITKDKLSKARALEHEIYFSDMDLITAWPKSKQAFKQAGYSLVLADEVSTWPMYAADMLRKRTDTYRFSHICGISSADPQGRKPSNEDPIFIEYDQTDKRYWFMVDPGTGNLFRFEMGREDSVHGLKWSQDARLPDKSWDLDIVKATAYYVTPDGTRIDNNHRLDLVAGGKWIPTSKGKEGRRGYHINNFYMPFKSGDFGTIAAAFLEHKHKGMGPGQINHTTFRIFMYEYLAEPYYEMKDGLKDDELLGREKLYRKGERISDIEPYKTVYLSRQKTIITSVDVQKDYLITSVREWIDTGDSGLVTWKPIMLWHDLDVLFDETKTDYCAIDFGYAMRQMEVLQYCCSKQGNGPQWVIPLKGEDNQNLPISWQWRDPFEGKSAQGNAKVKAYTWNTNIFRTFLLQLMRGESKESWSVYKNLESEASRQMCSTEKIDGIWRKRPGYYQDHLFDCEAMGLVAATMVGYFKNYFFIEQEQDTK